MSFWDFLNWLWGGISKVLAWFGAEFWTLYNGAKSALTWAVNFAQKAFADAQGWVIAQAFALATDLTNTANWLWGQIKAVYTAIATAVSKAVSDIVAWASNLIQAARDYAAGLFDAVKSWAKGLIDSAITSLTNTIITIKNDILGLFNPLLVLKPILTALTDLASTDIYNKLKSLVTTMYTLLNTLVNNPVGFLTGLLFPIFAEIICYAIGYGMGAVESTLPPLPTWGHGDIGGKLPPYIIPPGTGVLVHPIDPIWVSGYSFTPPTHYGVDLGLSYGQEVHAMHNGVVLESGWSNVGYGNTVVIKNDTWISRYGHFETCLVQAGQEVIAGQVIGYGNTTGNSTGNHLHLELRLYGTYVDPLLYL